MHERTAKLVDQILTGNRSAFSKVAISTREIQKDIDLVVYCTPGGQPVAIAIPKDGPVHNVNIRQVELYHSDMLHEVANY